METRLELPTKTAATNTRSLQERQAALLAALESFMEQDKEEHQDTLRTLRQSLDENRQGQRLIFGEGNALQ